MLRAKETQSELDEFKERHRAEIAEFRSKLNTIEAGQESLSKMKQRKPLSDAANDSGKMGAKVDQKKFLMQSRLMISDFVRNLQEPMAIIKGRQKRTNPNGLSNGDQRRQWQYGEGVDQEAQNLALKVRREASALRAEITERSQSRPRGEVSKTGG